jgi:site-specific DNA-methyltransferase (adenine-specific)
VTALSNRLFRSDALHLPRHVAPASADLVYLDPPFAVGTAFGARTKLRETRARGSATAGPVAYDDRWPSLEAYLAWLRERLEALAPLVAPHGTLWLHLDHRAVHEAKALLDAIPSAGRFAFEIIWVPGNGSKGRHGPSMTHQTLLVYAKDDAFVWNRKDPVLRESYAKTSLAMHFTKIDADGRRFRERVVGGKTYKYFADEGRALGSVWSDCPAMLANTPLRRETTGYPTQKPLKLLDRIVRGASRPEGLVVDAFCGSGTTLEAAAKAGRRFVGGDIGDLALRTTRTRLDAAGVPYEFVDAQ